MSNINKRNCGYCYYCNFCNKLKMTEYNIFCASETYNDDNSFQQPRYRAFNKKVGKERYNQISKLIKNDIFKDFTLDTRRDWTEEWRRVTPEQWKRLSEIPEYDADVVEMVVGFKPQADDATEEAMKLLKEKGYKIIRS